MRVLTYNIRGGLGMDRHRSIRRIAAVIRDAGADLVGLQEVHQRLPQSRLTDQPRALARETGLRCLFGPALSFGIGQYGNAVLCRQHAGRQQVHHLPGEGEPRAALAVPLDMEGRPLTFFCTHWGLSMAARLEQAAELAAAIHRTGGPVIVVGDLNAAPDAPEVRRLLETGLRHVSPPVEPTFPADRPCHRIDYILISAELAGGASQVLATQASDHRPVVADLWWAGAG